MSVRLPSSIEIFFGSFVRAHHDRRRNANAQCIMPKQQRSYHILARPSSIIHHPSP
jgi:hypothetical protein